MAKDASKINIKDVIISAEKKEPLVFECSGDDKCPNNRHDTCKIYPIINNLQNKINVFLTDITLEQILK